MPTIITLAMSTIGLLILGMWLAIKAVALLGGSRLFWIIVTAASLVLFPITLGMSPLVVLGLVVIRLILLGKVFDAPGPRGQNPTRIPDHR